jgi:glycosyltransferase involved in cell wall biosynthesis
VVATAVDGTPEAIRDGETGLTVPPGDSAALARAILRLVREPALARRLARAGRRMVEREFTIERQTRETQLLYQEIFSRAVAPRAVRTAAASAASAGWEGERP